MAVVKPTSASNLVNTFRSTPCYPLLSSFSLVRLRSRHD